MAEVRGAAADGGGGGRGGSRGEPEAGVGLFARTGRLIEDRTVNFGNNDVIATERVETRRGTEGKRVEFRLREEVEIYRWYGIYLEWRFCDGCGGGGGGGIHSGGSHGGGITEN